MDEQQLRQLKPELDSFLDSFAPLFGRDENQAHARRLVQGLLHKGERRNAENIAEALQGGPVRSLQAFPHHRRLERPGHPGPIALPGSGSLGRRRRRVELR